MLNSRKTSLKAGLIALAALTCASCAQDGFLLDSGKRFSDMTITLSMNETKTVNDGMHTIWGEDDSISLLAMPLDGTGYFNYEFEYSSDGEGGNEFEGRIENHGDVNSFYAVYPYNAKLQTPKSFPITVNKTPVQEGNNSTAHLAGKDFPLYGKHLKVAWGAPVSISMENILSVAKFKVTNTTESPIVVKSIEFTSSNYITGAFLADITVDDPIWEPKDGASTKIALTVNNGEEIASGSYAEFFAGILPNVCAAGKKLKVKITANVNSQDIVFYRLIELTSTTSFYSSYRKEINCSFDTEHSEDPWPESEVDTPEESEKYYYKVTATPGDWEGTYLFVDEENSVAFAENKSAFSTPVEIVDGKIEAKPTLAENQMIVTTSEKGAGKFDIKTIKGYYLYCFGGNILFDSNISNGNIYYNLLSVSNGKVVVSSTYGESNKRFGFVDGRFNYVNDESSVYSTAGVAFYRLGKSSSSDEPGTDPSKDTQTISFSSEEVNWSLDDSYQVGASYSIPELSGAVTEVTYTSSNQNVAKIENNKIVILAAGTTIIKATAAETDTVNGATASFTLNITSSDQPVASTYVKVTSEPTSWDGTYLVVNESAGKAFAPFTANASSYAVSVTISNGTIASDGNIDTYAITVSDAGQNHENDNVSSLRAYNVKNSDGKYIWWSSNFSEYDSARLIENSTNTATNSSTTYTYFHTFKYDGGVQMASAINTSSGNAYYLGCSSSEFAYSSSSSSNRVQLYKLSGGQSGQQSQTLSFAKSSINWTLGSVCEVGEVYSIQNLSGTYYTAVSYSSSNPSVATIVDGNIMVQGAGTTTITATAAASGSYKSATAYYTLTISESGSSGTVAGYELLTSTPSDWSGSYLLVDTDKAYLFNGETGKNNDNRVALSSSDFNGDIITNSSYSQYAFTISKSGSDYYFKKDGKYYYTNYSSNSTTGIVTSSSSDDAAFSFDGMHSSGGFLFYQVTSSTNQYIYYKASEDAFKFGKSGADCGILLYKLNDGTISPDTPVKPSDDPQEGDYFVKVTSEPSSWEGTYLVVDENSGKAFNYDSESSYATSVTISNGKIAYTSSLDGIALRVTDAGLDHPNTQMASDVNASTLRAYNVKTKGGQYIYSSSSSVQVNDSNSKTSSGTTTTYYHAFRYDNGVYMLSSGNYGSSSSSNKYYYSLSYSDGEFAYGRGKDNLAKVQLYKLNGTSGGGSSTDPTPSDTAYNLENSYLSQYLDAAATSYTNSTTNTIVSTYSGSSNARDLPKPVSLTWSGNATSITIYEGSGSNKTKVKEMSFSSSSSVDVYNLIPGKTYSYSTSNGQTGTFNTSGRRRMIKVSSTESRDHARNCRDLGGIKTRNGETLKYGLMYRGTNMDQVTTEEKKILVNELGIKLDQDLRGASSSPIDVEVSGEKYDANTIQNQDGTNMANTVLDVMQYVINGDPVYIHCYIGSDRTGHMCMLYEALLGVELKECDIDYEITSFASAIVYGTRTRGSGNESSFRSKFAKSPYSTETIPEAVEEYVTGTLGIPLNTVKQFRKAMGVSETL